MSAEIVQWSKDVMAGWSRYLRQSCLLSRLESLPVSPSWDDLEAPLLSRGGPVSLTEYSFVFRSPRPWTRLEMEILMTIYKEKPLWSYWDIATQLRLLREDGRIDFGSRFGHDMPWSPKDCARRLHELYEISPERFDATLPPPPLDSLNVVHTSGESDTDPLVTNLQPTLCDDCTALNLGKAHMDAMLDFDDWCAGPDTKQHPASRSLLALNRSAETCPCCKFMYNAAASHFVSSTGELSPERASLQIRLGFIRESGEHQLSIKTTSFPQRELARLRMAHRKVIVNFHTKLILIKV